MADYDSGLPIRSEADGSDERVHVKIVDGVASPAVNRTEVDADNNLHVEIHGNDPAGDDQVVRLSEIGAVTPDGVYDASNNTKPGNVGVIVSDRATTPGDTTQKFRVTGVQGTDDDEVHAMDVALHDEAGNAYSATNPLPVTISVNEGGTEVVSHKASVSDLARHVSETQDYTVTALKKLRLSKVWAAGSGKIKAELKIAGASVAVKFNSTAEPNIEFAFQNPVTVAAGAKVEVVMTNNDYQAFAVYSTILGIELDA